MNAFPTIDMNEVTRLTREGRLQEAMAMLQGAAAGSPPNLKPDGTRADTARKPSLLDMVPPKPGSGGAWTAPSPEAAEPSRTAGAPPPPVADMLRGLKERMGHLGTDKSFHAFSGAAMEAAKGARPQAADVLRNLTERMGQLGAAGGLDGLGGAAMKAPAVPLPEGARFDEHVYTNEAGSRSYKLYVPSRYRGEPLPLVVMLHGCTQSPDDFAAGTRMNELAEEELFLVAYPAQTPSANMQKCWNWFNAGDQQRDRGEPSLIAGMTRQIMRDYPVEQERVFIAGLSAGGAAAAIMGATYPDLYAAIGVHSGLACGAAKDMPSAFAAMRQGGAVGARPAGRASVVRTIVFHGDGDTTVNPVNGDQVIAQAAGAAARPGTVSRGEAPGGIGFTRTVWADESGQAMVEQWTLHGAGHAWSGGSAAGSYTEPRGPDASREMLRFFLQPGADRPV